MSSSNGNSRKTARSLSKGRVYHVGVSGVTEGTVGMVGIGDIRDTWTLQVGVVVGC